MTPPFDTIQCHRCGSRDTRRIVRKGLLNSIMRLVGRVPYHCQGCYQVLFARRPETA